MPRWTIEVEQTTGSGDLERWSPRVLAEVVGTREQAMAEMTALIPGFTPPHPKRPGRRAVLRDGHTYLLIASGWADDIWQVVSATDHPEIAETDATPASGDQAWAATTIAAAMRSTSSVVLMNGGMV
ncbi:hypothetical protein ACWEO2_37705 [Nocardia sp. NPDC004278]